MTDKLKARLIKLLALAQDGVGGEKESAATILESLMRKHSCTLEDLGIEETKTVWLKPAKMPFGKELLIQTIGAVVDQHNLHIFRSSHMRGCIGVDLTPAQEIEVELRYSAYCKGLKNQLKISYRAFLQKNYIFPDTSSDVSAPQIDEEELHKIRMAMIGMDKVTVHKALPDVS